MNNNKQKKVNLRNYQKMHAQAFRMSSSKIDPYRVMLDIYDDPRNFILAGFSSLVQITQSQEFKETLIPDTIIEQLEHVLTLLSIGRIGLLEAVNANRSKDSGADNSNAAS